MNNLEMDIILNKLIIILLKLLIINYFIIVFSKKTENKPLLLKINKLFIYNCKRSKLYKRIKVINI